MRFYDLFGGVGGFRLGLERAGDFRCVGYCDNNEWSVGVYNHQFNEKYSATDARELKTFPNFDILCAGFPCQPFSITGRRKGLEDARGNLFLEIKRVARIKRPSYLFLENVRGLLDIDRGETFKVIIKELGSLGYDLQWMVLNSSFFGVPQRRERVFIIGNLGGTPMPTILPFEKGLLRYERVPRGPEPEDPLMVFRGHVQGNMRKRVRTIHDNTTWCLGGCETILVQPETMAFRRLTPREYERLQSFPDDWTRHAWFDGAVLEVSDHRRKEMMGNAVTVNVIEAIGKALSFSIKSNS